MRDVPPPIAALLGNRAFGITGRIVLTFPFWGSGLAKLIDFPGARGEMGQFGLHPTAAFAVAVIVTQIAGSSLVIHGRHAWIGAGWLAIFTALTIPVVHHFWNMTGFEGLVAFHTAAEHIGMIGGLMLAAIQSHLSRPGS